MVHKSRAKEGVDMKVGVIVKDKETGKLGYVYCFCRAMNWRWVYWFEEDRKEKVVNHSLEVICEAR